MKFHIYGWGRPRVSFFHFSNKVYIETNKKSNLVAKAIIMLMLFLGRLKPDLEPDFILFQQLRTETTSLLCPANLTTCEEYPLLWACILFALCIKVPRRLQRYMLPC